ncbi:MAG TPA: ketopantoate reductase family protein [Bacteroidales bacterium]|nr:ketopantoate reductase family protein [Bacteroidales bacterium]
MHIAIYGAGSIGTVLGAFITKNGLDIDLISRNTAHIGCLKTNGARITGTVEMSVPVKALLPEEITKRYDILFLITKTTDNTNTVKSCVPCLADEGIICTLQNGLPEMSVAEIIGDDRTFGCAVAWGATFVGNGICELTSEPESITFSIGSFSKNADPDKLNSIKNILSLMGHVDVADNFMGARWAKLLINCSFSGMSAVLGCTYGEAAENKVSRKCIQRIIKECIDVSRKANIKIEPVQGKDICKLLDYSTKIKEYISFLIIPIAIKKHRLLKASMLQDLEKGKKCEVEAINGIVCKFGEKYHCPTPYNDMVVKIIHEIEQGNIKPGFDNLNRFENLI